MGMGGWGEEALDKGATDNSKIKKKGKLKKSHAQI